MTRTMYDAVDASKIPANALMVAGYVDGLYAWSDADWARFKGAVKLRIAIRATTVAHILDIETGNDMNPADWVSWAQLVRREYPGFNPIAYMNTSTWPSVRSAFRSRGVAEPSYWVAQYDGVAQIPAGTIGKQYYNNNSLGYDLSIVVGSIPGIDASPIPAPVPVPIQEDEDDMPQQIESLAQHPTGEYTFAFPKGKYFEVGFVTDLFGDSPDSLRVVFWTQKGPEVHDSVSIVQGATVLGFSDAADTYAVSVVRKGTGSHPIGVAFK